MSNQTQYDGWRALFTLARRLVHSWWQGDRIRASPTTGELLRLWPPCCLHVNGQYAQIMDRRVQGDSTPTVVYNCRTDTDSGTLIVKVDSATAIVAVEWHQSGQVVQLVAADVEVY